jgi:hypothetical protein
LTTARPRRSAARFAAARTSGSRSTVCVGAGFNSCLRSLPQLTTIFPGDYRAPGSGPIGNRRQLTTAMSLTLDSGDYAAEIVERTPWSAPVPRPAPGSASQGSHPADLAGRRAGPGGLARTRGSALLPRAPRHSICMVMYIRRPSRSTSSANGSVSFNLSSVDRSAATLDTGVPLTS